jgi:methylated-DNA-[protein]-cysteine S-methyltransferase
MSVSEIIVASPLALHLKWDGDVLAVMRLSWAEEGQTSRIETSFGREMAHALARYVAGEAVTWPEPPIDFEALPRFHRKVLNELRRVPAGQVVSYGGLAAACGSPGAARAVGQVMARNRWPLIYPCHRVLAAGGGLGGFGPGLEMKKWLLTLEGGQA